MIIDGHVHSGGYAGYSTDDIIRLADRAGFEMIFATDTVALHYNMQEGNRRLADDMKRFPGRMIGYASVTSARYGKEVVEEIQRCYEVYGMRGVKVIHQTAGLGSYQLLTTINEPAMYPIFAKAAELGMPILAHATPEECAALSEVIPEAMILMAHTGGHPTAMGDWFNAIQIARHYPNIYLDTASSQSDMGYLEAAVAGVGAERVIFGTDMPLIDPFFGLAKVTGADLTDEQKALILGGNLKRLLGL